MNPMLDGNYVFGTACHVMHVPQPAAVQQDAFFGVAGRTSLFGGTRGRTFRIRGVFVGETLEEVLSYESSLLSYGDGIARIFTDTQGRDWPNIVFLNEYRPSAEGPKITDFGWCLPYECVLHGLS